MISPLLILNYHRITKGTIEVNTEYLEYTLDIAEFERQLHYLSTYCNVLPPSEWFLPSDLPLRVGLTFDDGNYSDLEFALPILEKFGFKALFFPVVNWLENKDYLSIKDLKTIESFGHSVQAHSISHPDFIKLSSHQRSKEIEDTIAFFEQKLDLQVKYFALPYGNYLADWEGEFKKMNISTVFSTGMGINKRSNFEISRINIKRSTNAKEFRDILNRNKFHSFRSNIKCILKKILQRLKYIFR